MSKRDVASRHHRALRGEELEQLAAEVAANPALWRDLVRHDSSERRYAEVLRDEHVSIWLICWMGGHDTGFHDHDVSAGAVAVIAGCVREQRLVLDGEPRDRRCGPGEVFSFSPADIHRVNHEGDEPAVTVHVYSPPLARMGAYYVGDDGVLRRRSIPAEEELRPVAHRTHDLGV
jgi:predicted metal-dependent enzyme (double-stranded beta helix superfamily)